MRDAAIHRVLMNAGGFVSSLAGSQWIATGLRPRDDKVREGIVGSTTLSLRGENEVNDAAIHRVSRGGVRLVSSLAGAQWIATDLRPRDDKV